MKEKNFNRTTLNLYDKQLVEQLEQSFKSSGMHSKSEYLSSLIRLGLQTRNMSEEIIGLAEQINELQNGIKALQQCVLNEQTENKAYKFLLCNIYHIVEAYCIDGRCLNEESLELGTYNFLPTRLYLKSLRNKEVYDGG